MQKLVLCLTEDVGNKSRTYYKTFSYDSRSKALEDLTSVLMNKREERKAVSSSNRIFQKEIYLLQEVQRKEVVEGKSALDKKILSLYDKINRFDPNFKFSDLSVNFFECLEDDGVTFGAKILTLDEWYDSKR